MASDRRGVALAKLLGGVWATTVPVILIAVVMLVGALSFLRGCLQDLNELSALGPAPPTRETGVGNTEELREALAIFAMKLPEGATEVEHTLTSSIDSFGLGLRFRTDGPGVSQFLASIQNPEVRDLSEGDLAVGKNPWEPLPARSAKGPESFGWHLDGISNYTGLSVDFDSSLGWLGVLVDLDQPAPVVYVEALSCC